MKNKKFKMKNLGIILLSLFLLTSCAKQQEEPIEVLEGEALVYLAVKDAVASSFDDTPDWAPLPNAMAAVDRDMLTRWSPKLGVDNEWIYFDFGKEKVLNKIVIRWENAFATEYEILTSSDAKKWMRLLLKEDGRGAMETLEFSPIKARYVKIIGLKRINDQWGFSMWEFEPYGPQSLNPGEKIGVSEEAELKKKREELDRLLEEEHARLTPSDLEQMQNGICYTSWTYDELSGMASDFTLIHLKKLGVTHIAIVVPTYQNEIDSSRIFTNDFEGGDTPSDESIEHCIKICHLLGMKVMLKPHVDPRDGTPRMDIIASEEWFNSYEKMILHYAALAEKNKVEIFSVGTELEGTTFSRWENEWRDVISKIKAVYSGYVTYSANWTEYETVPFWDMMDFVGIDAYFPLTKNYEATEEELIAAWEAIAQKIADWRTEQGIDKYIIFTEAGYPSSDGANKQPWVQITNVEDQKEQRDCLNALLEVMTQKPYFKGMYLWHYLPQDRWSPLGFTVKDKVAEEVLKDWYKK